ncbi:MAG: PilT/PilU family type 4a pilus ATPase, partial [candidate division NC10 bacterium]|nr:PilT/PilU family type 4a pilus ATPase [candidate division NC10 bacterium]
QIPSKIMTVEELGLSSTVSRLALLKKGLVLVTGPTGSGKSTTLAAIVDHANKVRRDNIITIEDPVEFMHQSQSCVISHREVGRDTRSFAAALRGALREDPDIILVGEMRDLETIFLAIEAASTGHLVFGTLHTQNASKTVDRIIDIFPANQQAQIRATLADTLKAVVAQTLFKRIDVKGRCAGLEILMVTPAVSNLIREGKTFQIPGVIQTGKKYGMVTLEDSIMEFLKKKWIAPEEAYDKAVDKAKFLPFLSKPPEELGLA